MNGFYFSELQIYFISALQPFLKILLALLEFLVNLEVSRVHRACKFYFSSKTRKQLKRFLYILFQLQHLTYTVTNAMRHFVYFV